MAPPALQCTFLTSLLSLLLVQLVRGQLSYDHYASSCPQAESIVRSAVSSTVASDPNAPAGLLRLAFHDCQVGGCDASIMLNSQGGMTSEMASGKNFGLRQLGAIDRAKAAVDSQCGAGLVSCADIIAMAGRDAVALSGGPNIQIPFGRKDSTFTSNKAADSSLPSVTISVDNFLAMFGSMGMSLFGGLVVESIAGGGHSLGVGHCVSIINRLYPSTDSNLGFVYATRLRISCPTSDPRFILNSTTIQNDFTALTFDNQYFRDTSSGLGLFTIDSELANDPRTGPVISSFAQNQNDFFSSFASAYTKLTASRVLTE